MPSVEIIFFLVGLCFLAIGSLIVLSEVRARRGAVEVPGELIGFSAGKSRASGAASFHAVAQYAGLDGQTRYVEASVGSSSPLGTVGDPLRVLVQPADPEKASIKSSLSYVLGIVLALMGLGSCIVFFAMFRITAFSVAGAAAVVGWGAWKLRGSLREKAISPQAWRDYRSKLAHVRVFTDATKAGIPWANPAAVEAASRNQQRSNRLAIPFLVLAGVGLIFLGAHLYRRTEVFLEKAVRGTGVVVALAANHSSNGVTWAPVVEFEHEGRRHRFKDSVSSNPASHGKGDVVDVLYDPSRPADARIDRGRWNKAIPILVAAFGVLLCSLGLWMYSRRAPDSDRPRTTAG